tara:strand:+ start:79 stop:483 length:405 start_codon:yes stop_codon:yes gene_type:complete
MVKIYFIECLDTGDKYIGSTTQKYLTSRIRQHVYSKKCSCKTIIDRGNYHYGLIEEVELDNRYIREQYWIDNTDKCINKRNPILSNYLKLESRKRYRTNNRDKINECKKFSKSWGGDERYNNNLLRIDLSLFKG